MLVIVVLWVVARTAADALIPAPGARAGNAAAVLGGRIYAVGGAGPGAGSEGRVESLDPITGTWRDEASLQQGRTFHGAAAAGGLLYALGGTDGGSSEERVDHLRSMEVLDPETGLWTPASPAPHGINRLTAVSDGTTIYTVGGMAEGPELQPRPIDVATVLVFDTESNTWDSLPPMPQPRHGTTAVILDEVLYVMGGYGVVPGQFSGPLASVDAYDLNQRTWSKKTPLLVPRGFAGSAVVNGRIYLFGGRTTTRPITEVYDPRTDSWTAAARIPRWRNRFAYAQFDGSIYVIGGEANFGVGYGRKVLVYDVAEDRWSGLRRRR